MITLKEFKDHLEKQGLWEREIEEIVNDCCIEQRLDEIQLEEFTISKIENAVEFAENYIDEMTSNKLLKDYIDDLKSFAMYIANREDYIYLDSSDRIIIWEF